MQNIVQDNMFAVALRDILQRKFRCTSSSICILCFIIILADRSVDTHMCEVITSISIIIHVFVKSETWHCTTYYVKLLLHVFNNDFT